MNINKLIIQLWSLINIISICPSCTAKTNHSPRSSPRRRTNTTQKNNKVENDSIPTTCNFFLWDVIGACRYRLYQRLIRDNVYEGMGGKKFVRIKPGSMLEKLYPLPNDPKNACVNCGKSFQEHLEYWTYHRNHSKKPYFNYIESMYQDALIDYKKNADDDYLLLSLSSQFKKNLKELIGGCDESIHVLAFHRRYPCIGDGVVTTHGSSLEYPKSTSGYLLLWFELIQFSRFVARQAKENAMIIKQHGF